jgi:hypothetical protein
VARAPTAWELSGMNNRNSLVLGILGASLLLPAAALAAPGHSTPTMHSAPRAASAPAGKSAGARVVGVHVVPHPDRPMHPTTNSPHQIIIHNTVTNKDENHVVIVDHRPAHIVGHDARIRVSVRGYHPQHNWGYYHVARGGWFHLWGITAWDNVGTVTCEAANETTGELYPVTMDRDAHGWDDDGVNVVLDNALDDCFAEANGAQCTPATPSCSFQNY